MGYTFGVGREAPVFTLTAVDGTEVALKSYRGDWLPILLFYSPGTPDMATRLTAMSAAADQLWGFRGQLLGVCDAPAGAQRALAEQAGGVAFPMLVDEGAVVARAYGAYSPRTGAVQPAAYIVDRAGKIVWVGDGADALNPAALLAALESATR